MALIKQVKRNSTSIPCLTMFYLLLLMGFLSQIGHTKEESNSFLYWAKQYAQDTRHDNCWICGLLPISRTEGVPWWVSPLQGNDWNKLQSYIREEQDESMVLRTATRSDVYQWPINLTLNQEGHGKHFSKRVTDAIIQRFPEPFLTKDRTLPMIRDKNHRYKDGYFQIRDEYIWLTPTMGQLGQVAPLCWEQRNHSRFAWANASTYLGWIHSDQCQHTIILQAEDWFATDWSSRPGVRWAAPNGTQWLCGTNLWPWLPPGWIGRCTLGFPWMQGRWMKTLDKPANLPVLRRRRTRDLSSNYVRSVGLRDVIWHIESLTRHLNKALNDTAKQISLLNVEVQLMRKAALQHQMALDALTAAKGGACAVLEAECCVYIANQSGLVEQGRPVQATSQPKPSFGERMWTCLFKTSGWKWLITVTSFVLVLLLFGPCFVECLLNFISSYLQSMFLQIVLSPVNPVMYIGPPTTPPGPESQQESGP